MNSPIFWLMFGCIVMASISASGCGHIDQDLDLTDEEIEAKYADELGLGVGVGRSVSYSSSCGGYGYASGYGYGSARPGRVMAAHDVTGDTAQNAPNARYSAEFLFFIARRDNAEDEDEDETKKDDTAPLRARKGNTWGDYLAQEMARAERLRAP